LQFHKNRADFPELKSDLIFLVNPAQITPRRNIKITRSGKVFARRTSNKILVKVKSIRDRRKDTYGGEPGCQRASRSQERAPKYDTTRDAF